MFLKRQQMARHSSPLEKFIKGSVRAKYDGRNVRAIRVRPTTDLKHPLALREFTIESTPPWLSFDTRWNSPSTSMTRRT